MLKFWFGRRTKTRRYSFYEIQENQYGILSIYEYQTTKLHTLVKSFAKLKLVKCHDESRTYKVLRRETLGDFYRLWTFAVCARRISVSWSMKKSYLDGVGWFPSSCAMLNWKERKYRALREATHGVDGCDLCTLKSKKDKKRE